MAPSVYHSSSGGFDFLGLRKGRCGGIEIVYDDGVTRRMVFRVVTSRHDPDEIGDALRSAVNQTRVLPALYSELKKRAIAIEAVAG